MAKKKKIGRGQDRTRQEKGEMRWRRGWKKKKKEINK